MEKMIFDLYFDQNASFISSSLKIDMIKVYNNDMKNKEKRFISTYLKGELQLKDTLLVDCENKILVYTFEIDDLSKIDKEYKRYITRKKMSKMIQRYKNQSFSITSIDGASSRASFKEVKEGLNLSCSLDRLILLSRSRLEIEDYYDINLFYKALNEYYLQRCNGVYLNYWCDLYSKALQEGMPILDKKIRSEYLLLTKILNVIAISLKNCDNKSDRKEIIDKIVKDLQKIDKKIEKTKR